MSLVTFDAAEELLDEIPAMCPGHIVKLDPIRAGTYRVFVEAPGVAAGHYSPIVTVVRYEPARELLWQWGKAVPA